MREQDSFGQEDAWKFGGVEFMVPVRATSWITFMMSHSVPGSCVRTFILKSIASEHGDAAPLRRN